MKKILLFVCTGKYLQIAHRRRRDARMCWSKADIADHWLVDSAGTHAYHTGEAARSAFVSRRQKKRGIRYRHAWRARKIAASDFEEFDIILGMDQRSCGKHCCTRWPHPTASANIATFP